MTKHIVVLGAGYSGLIAAKLVAGQPDTAVTLVNARDRFVERVRLHQFASGQDLPERPLADLLDGTGISLVVDRVTGIDAEAKTVALACGEPLPYDTLVYALGSQADLDTVPGVREHAVTVAGVEGAARLRERAHGTVAVVGGGLTGIEAATELAETCPDLKVRLVTGGTFGEAFAERGQRHLRRVFERLRIDVRDGVRVAEVRADGLVLADGEHLSADTVVWTTGFRVSSPARDAGFEVDGHGRMVVDDTLRSVSHPDVYGIGDAAAARMATGQELRMACATGIPAAVYAARAIAARAAGRVAKPLKFRYVNQCVSLGRRDGLIQFVHADDSPAGAVLTGRAAAFYKEVICRGAYFAQRRPGLTSVL